MNSDEEQLVEELPEILSKQRILLLNLAWFGLSLMFLLMSVEGKFYHKFFFCSSLILYGLAYEILVPVAHA